MTRRSFDPRLQAAPLAGVGFKPEHAEAVLETPHRVGFFEVHAENYMGAGGPPHRMLEALRSRWPLSLHGVGLSIGAAAALDVRHLIRLRRLVDRYQPALFSEHLAWSSHGGVFLNDLLPLPYTRETLQRVCDHVDDVQETLRMRMFLENPATYVTFGNSTMSEIEVLGTIARRTGCGLLLDVNNVYVSAVNHGFAPQNYLDAFPMEHVGEIHLAGFAEDHDDDGGRLLIDAHGAPVDEAVWSLYRRAVVRCGPVPTLIERDNEIPTFATLAAEAGRAQLILAAEASRRLRRMAA
jgi:uncharacterized protein (UPF0276 family)